MGDHHVRPVQITAVLVILGCVALTAGVFGQFGPWWAMITAGTLAVVGAITLIDVDESDHKGDRK